MAIGISRFFLHWVRIFLRNPRPSLCSSLWPFIYCPHCYTIASLFSPVLFSSIAWRRLVRWILLLLYLLLVVLLLNMVSSKRSKRKRFKQNKIFISYLITYKKLLWILKEGIWRNSTSIIKIKIYAFPISNCLYLKLVRICGTRLLEKS